MAASPSMMRETMLGLEEGSPKKPMKIGVWL